MESAGKSPVQTRPTVDAAVINNTLPPYSFNRLIPSIRVETACLAIGHVILISPNVVGKKNFLVDRRVDWRPWDV